MPRPEWSFLMAPEDHMRLKWMMSYGKAKLTRYGQIIFGLLLVGIVASWLGSQISSYFFVSLVLALFLTSVFLALFFKPTVTSKRSMMPSPTVGELYTYRVTVTNTGRTPLRNLELFAHHLPYGLYETSSLRHQGLVEWLEPGQQVTFSLSLRLTRRGAYLLEPLLIGTSFPSGLIRSLATTADTSPLLVLPQLLKVNSTLLQENSNRKETAMEAPGGRGGSYEFLSTREYRDGDRPRDVHWNSSARMGRLIVKEYVQESSRMIGMFIDTELKSFEKHLCFEARIALAAGLAEEFYKQYTAVQLYSWATASSENGNNSTPNFASFLEQICAIEGRPQVNFSEALSQMESDGTHLSGLMLLLKDWDPKRAGFVASLKTLGVPLEIIIVRQKPLSLAPGGMPVMVYTPQALNFKL